MYFTCPFTAAVNAIGTAILSLPNYFSGTNLELRLLENNPAIGATTVLADLDTFDGGGIVPDGAGEDPNYLTVELLSGKKVIVAANPTDGWKFVSVNGTNLPKVAYGIALVQDDTFLVGVAKFDNPITVSASGQTLFPGPILFELSATPIG